MLGPEIGPAVFQLGQDRRTSVLAGTHHEHSGSQTFANLGYNPNPVLTGQVQRTRHAATIEDLFASAAAVGANIVDVPGMDSCVLTGRCRCRCRACMAGAAAWVGGG